MTKKKFKKLKYHLETLYTDILLAQGFDYETAKKGAEALFVGFCIDYDIVQDAQEAP